MNKLKTLLPTALFCTFNFISTETPSPRIPTPDSPGWQEEDGEIPEQDNPFVDELLAEFIEDDAANAQNITPFERAKNAIRRGEHDTLRNILTPAAVMGNLGEYVQNPQTGENLLHEAVSTGTLTIEVVHMLVEEFHMNEFIHESSPRYASPLHLAAQLGDVAPEVFDYLCEHVPLGDHIRSAERCTLLHAAADWGNLVTVHKLLRAGLSPRAEDHDGLSPYAYAQIHKDQLHDDDPRRHDYDSVIAMLENAAQLAQ